MSSGSSLFTLGFQRPSGLGSAFIAFGEAAIGLALLAVLFAYLPTIYGSFSRREVMVTQLSVRAGTPPTAWRALELAHVRGTSTSSIRCGTSGCSGSRSCRRRTRRLPRSRLPVAESEPVVDHPRERSSTRRRSARGVEHPVHPAPGLCIRSGFLGLREIADFFGFDHDRDPSPDDPISVAKEEFMEIYERLGGRGCRCGPIGNGRGATLPGGG